MLRPHRVVAARPKYTAGHLKGMLLEEAILYLLKTSGYKAVEGAGDDPTLRDGHSGLEVCGRGTQHQIDAVADYIVPQPFSNQPRLLIEAKCYRESVGIDVIRNSVGVTKDVGEYWQPISGGLQNKRYHYQSAVFSGTDFTSGAQKYAFAHDIYLLPLGRSEFFKPILEAIDRCGEMQSHYAIATRFRHFKDLRRHIRESLQGSGPLTNNQCIENDERIGIFIQKVTQLRFTLLAVLGGRFGILLTPANSETLQELEDRVQVRIFRNEMRWFLQRPDGRDLFSFDLPIELFHLYASEGFLSAAKALELKRDFMSALRAIVVQNGVVRIINFEIDLDWLEILLAQKRRFGE